MKRIPNLFTLLNLVFGCLAIVFILQNGITAAVGPDGVQYISVPEKTVFASLFIGLAGLVDFLGLAANTSFSPVFVATSTIWALPMCWAIYKRAIRQARLRS